MNIEGIERCDVPKPLSDKVVISHIDIVKKRRRDKIIIKSHNAKRSYEMLGKEEQRYRRDDSQENLSPRDLYDEIEEIVEKYDERLNPGERMCDYCSRRITEIHTKIRERAKNCNKQYEGSSGRPNNNRGLDELFE